MQDGKPISYGSRATTDTEQNCPQIEKESLARFNDYFYGRDVVHVYTDHKPLGRIFKKEIGPTYGTEMFAAHETAAADIPT